MMKKRMKKRMKLGEISVDSHGRAVMSTPEMGHYIDFLAATIASDGEGVDKALAKIRGLPIQKRYTSRILLALQWGFADFDSESIKTDLKANLSMDDLLELDRTGLDVRAAQFCKFLAVLFGVEEMKKIMATAIDVE